MAGFTEAETRAEFYEDVADCWRDSPQDLVEAMDDCEPLAWAVHSIYSDSRDELLEEISSTVLDESQSRKRIESLKSKLRKLPEEPEEGAADWLLSLTASEFETIVVPHIQGWFSESPSWVDEDDHLPETFNAQGAAMVFFQRMKHADLDLLGVSIVEGDRPGSTYYAAELHGDIDQANRIAEGARIAVRFLQATD